MKTITSLLSSTLFLAYAGVASASLTGSVAFKGAAPKAEPIKMDADPKCKQLSGGKAVDNDIVVNGGKLADVFVYVKNAPAGTYAPKGAVTLDQKACMYHPKMLGLMVKQDLEIVNSDPTLHNIHAFSKKGEFNVGMPTQGQKLKKQFKKAEVLVPIKCDVHPWMHAWAGVVEHPFFGVSNDKGDFTIENLPDGDYEVVAVHGKLGEQTAKVKVAGGAGTAAFTFGN